MKEKESKYRLIDKIIIISAIFPYNSFILMTPTDVQPIAVIFILLSVPTLSLSTSSSITIFLMFCLSVFHINHSTDILSIGRSIFGYLSAFLIFNYFAYIDQKTILFVIKTIKIAILIYFISAIINLIFVSVGQEEIFQNLLSLIKSRASVTVGNRGVSGILPEPSFMSLTMYLLLLIYLVIEYTSNRNYTQLLQYSFIVLVSALLTYSGTVLFLIISIFLCYCLTYNTKAALNMFKTLPFLLLFPLIGLLSEIVNLGNHSDLDTRFGDIVNKIMGGGLSSLLEDASIFDRFWAFYAPFTSLFKHDVTGYGTSGWSSFMNSSEIAQDIIYSIGIQNNVDSYVSTSRLMNLFGNYIVDFGWIGVFAIVFFLISIKSEISKSYPPSSLKLKNFAFLNTILICLQAIPVAHPLPWVLFGLLVNSNRKVSNEIIVRVPDKEPILLSDYQE